MAPQAFRVVLTLSVFLLAAVNPLTAAPMTQLVGAGLIGGPIPGKTIDSPSDFGFAATRDGGTFVCSMAGPLPGGFKGLKASPRSSRPDNRRSQHSYRAPPG